MPSLFKTLTANISKNDHLRIPQREAFEKLQEYAASPDSENREVGIVLPVGCGKSGCITLTPFAFGANRALVIAPGLNIADQLDKDFDPTKPTMFYRKCLVLTTGPFPEPVKIRGTTTNHADLEESDVVITNIQQLQGGEDNRWLKNLPPDFFDLIIFDEGHHSIASSWEQLKAQFPDANIVNYSATPLRADGKKMAGKIIYNFPIFRAIEEGYVKHLKAVQLNPRTLRYVRHEDGEEIEVSLDEVRKLGEEDADFRRSIVTSNETLITIVNASLNELNRLRSETGENRLKIIASALNFEHCRQIVEAYLARGVKADYVHSRIDTPANNEVLRKLDAHELDVIVQVRKLGEGFDHPYLSVAAVFSIFSNLSPFVQFVGRIMRVIEQNKPKSLVNRGVVIFHAGANIAQRWSDFQEYSEADREYFDQLLPLQGLETTDPEEQTEYEPILRELPGLEVRSQSEVVIQEIPLLPDDEAAAIKLLQERGKISADFDPATQILQPVATTRAYERQALRAGLDIRVRTAAARILSTRGINPGGKILNKRRDGKTNFIIMKSAIDRHVNSAVGKGSRERSDFTRPELDEIDQNFDIIVEAAIKEVFNE